MLPLMVLMKVLVKTPLGTNVTCKFVCRCVAKNLGSESLKEAKEHLRKAHGLTTRKDDATKRHATDRNVEPMVPKWSEKSAAFQSLVADIARWFAVDRLPPNNVEKPGFNAFMQKYWPAFPGVSKMTLTSRIQELGVDFQQWLIEWLKTVDYYSLTTDGWTSDAKDSYRCVTLHFTNSDTGEYISFVLASRPCGRNAVAISDFLRSVLDEFQLDVRKCVACVTDSCKAEIAALRRADIHRVSCVNHWLNLCLKTLAYKGKPARGVKPAKPASPTAPLLAKAHSLAVFFHNTPVAMEALKGEVKDAEKLPCLPGETRWNGQYLMLSSLMPIRAEMEAVIRGRRIAGLSTPDELTVAEWQAVGQIVAILKPFQLYADRMQSSGVILSRMVADFWALVVFPVFYLKPAEDQNLDRDVRQWKAQLKAEIGRRFEQNVLGNDVILSALALDPVQKVLVLPGNFRNDLKLEVIPKFIVGETTFDHHDRPLQVNRQIDACAQALKNMLRKFDLLEQAGLQPEAALPDDVETLYRMTVGHYSDVSKMASQKSDADKEIRNWFDFKTQGTRLDVDRVQWWQQHGHDFPRLQKLARILLPVPASAAASERNWSSAGYLSHGVRSRISPKTLEASLLVSSNAKKRAQMMGVGLFEGMHVKLEGAGKQNQ